MIGIYNRKYFYLHDCVDNGNIQREIVWKRDNEEKGLFNLIQAQFEVLE